MSKFLVLVLVPLDTSRVLQVVWDLLMPYWADNDRTNPIAEWDYWTVGGLWDGVLTGGLSRVETVDVTYPSGGRLTGRRVPENQNDEEWLGNNQIAVADLAPVAEWDEQAGAYAVVTPDGQWHNLWEHRKGEASIRKLEYFQTLLDRHRDCWAITVMCHS